MKITKLTSWIGATLWYSYLFYEQSAGINFLLFNSALLLLVFTLQPTLRRQPAAVAIASGCLVTALNVAWHPTGAAIAMNVVSLAGLSGLSLQPKASLLVAWINVGYSLAASFITRFFKRGSPAASKKGEEGTATLGKPSAAPVVAGVALDRLMFRSVPWLVVGAFFFIYTQASPAFASLFSQFSLDFVSFGWVVFTLLGAYLLLVFFYPVAIRRLVQRDLSSADELQRKRQKRYNTNPIGLRLEYRAAWLLFVLLNGLLWVFNAVDMFYLLTGRLPEGVTHSNFVHQGVNMLIVSVVLAIAVVMYFFRGNLNFLRNNQRLRVVAYVWIVQNAVLIGTTASKNFSYIGEFGLTYKRIGVYVYLILTLIGLITTFIKVRDIKSNWFLLRKNAWLFYTVLIIFSTVDWGRAITRYNVQFLNVKAIDVDYLISLPATNLDLLQEGLSTYGLSAYQIGKLERRLTSFVERKDQEGWPSWNFAEYRVYQRVNSVASLTPAH